MFPLPQTSKAPSEAEAQCAELARGGKVYAAGSEDMDTLTFGSPILYRHLTFSEAKKQPISEIDLAKALEGLNMSMDQVCSDDITLLTTLTARSSSNCVCCWAVTTSSQLRA